MGIADAITAGLKTVREAAGETITYCVSPSLKASATAVKGSTEFTVQDERGISLVVRSVDFLFLLEDLAFLGGTMPQAGQVIERFANGRIEIYELNRFGNKPEWSWRDQGHTAIRVHTKFQRMSDPTPGCPTTGCSP